MAAYVSNIVIDVGTDFIQTFNLEDSGNAPLDLTSYTGSSLMKKHPSSLTTTATFAVSFPSPTQGQLRISLGSTVTNGLKPGRYVYDVLISDGSIKTRVVEGSAIVTAGVTTS
tara:strand:- start:7017 stop:7355 length:339 start_codon:yes stop_codon:yes gene_type:complete